MSQLKAKNHLNKKQEWEATAGLYGSSCVYILEKVRKSVSIETLEQINTLFKNYKYITEIDEWRKQ